MGLERGEVAWTGMSLARFMGAYGLDALGVVNYGFDLATFGGWSKAGELLDNTAKGAGGIAREVVQGVTGNRRLGQNTGDYIYLGLSVAGPKKLAVPAQIAGKALKASKGLQTARAMKVHDLAEGASTGVLRGTRNPKVQEAIRKGRKAHAEFAEKVKAKPGWKANERLKKGNTVLIPDAVSRAGKPVELKPNTPSGRKQGAKQLRKYEERLGKKGKVIYYEPK